MNNEQTMLLLYAVADGRVVRGEGGDVGIHAPFMLDGKSVRLGIMLLSREELVQAPISGPPRLAPRGQNILDQAIGVF